MENKKFTELEIEIKKAIIESLIFASDEPVSSETLMKIVLFSNDNNIKVKNGNNNIEDFPELAIKMEVMQEIEEIIQLINEDLYKTNRPYQIVSFAGGWQFVTRKEFGRFVHIYYKNKFNRKLSNAALEVLAIIAYKQPITKAEIEQIRGVNSNEVVNSLLDKNFIQIAGRKNVLGHPLMFEVTIDFLKAFGLNSLDDLPKIKEFEDIVLNELSQKDNDFFTFDLSATDLTPIESHIDDDDGEVENSNPTLKDTYFDADNITFN
jgi:segregation and condensation protein B